MEIVIIFIVVLGVVLWVKGKSPEEPKATPIPSEPSDPNLLQEMRKLHDELEKMENKSWEFSADKLWEGEFSHPDLESYEGQTHNILSSLSTALEPEFQKPPHIQRILIEAAKDIREKWKAELEKYKIQALEERQRIEETTRKHMDVLCRKYRQRAYVDEYGAIELAGFEDEILHFLNRTLPDIDQEAAVGNVLELIQREVNLNDSKGQIDYDSDMSPEEFENFCGEILKEEGWDVLKVGGSGDQGCDLVVSRGGIKGVIQCKLYSSPVGNKAVQEVYSGKEWEDAEFAAVVTNSSYTKSAKQLAAKNAVHLLHCEDLSQLSEISGLEEKSAEIDDDDAQQFKDVRDDLFEQLRRAKKEVSIFIDATESLIEDRERAVDEVGEDAEAVRNALNELRELNDANIQLAERMDSIIQALPTLDGDGVKGKFPEIRRILDERGAILNEFMPATENLESAFDNLDEDTKARLLRHGYTN